MLASVVFVPSAPLLVPELAGPAAHDTIAVRDAALVAGRWLAERCSTCIAVGTRSAHDPDGIPSVASVGSFLRFGVDLQVGLGPGPETRDTPETAASSGTGSLPLSMLIAAWLREQTGLETVEPIMVGEDDTPEACRDVGRSLGERISAATDRVGVLVVGDGSTSLTDRAPGGGIREASVVLQKRIDAALAAADLQTLLALDPEECREAGVGGRTPWQVAAALVADDHVGSTRPGEQGRPVVPRSLYADAPFGVGYTVATWELR